MGTFLLGVLEHSQTMDLVTVYWMKTHIKLQITRLGMKALAHVLPTSQWQNGPLYL